MFRVIDFLFRKSTAKYSSAHATDLSRPSIVVCSNLLFSPWNTPITSRPWGTALPLPRPSNRGEVDCLPITCVLPVKMRILSTEESKVTWAAIAPNIVQNRTKEVSCVDLKGFVRTRKTACLIWVMYQSNRLLKRGWRKANGSLQNAYLRWILKRRESANNQEG